MISILVQTPHLCHCLQAIPIISQTRFLEKKGELQELAKGATLFNTRFKFVPVYLFLFNDLLIIAAKKGWAAQNWSLVQKVKNISHKLCLEIISSHNVYIYAYVFICLISLISCYYAVCKYEKKNHIIVYFFLSKAAGCYNVNLPYLPY